MPPLEHLKLGHRGPPTLETAYSWTGSEYRHEPMVVSIWAHAERLLGGGKEGEIWRPTADEKLKKFLSTRRDSERVADCLPGV